MQYRIFLFINLFVFSNLTCKTEPIRIQSYVRQSNNEFLLEKAISYCNEDIIVQLFLAEVNRNVDASLKMLENMREGNIAFGSFLRITCKDNVIYIGFDEDGDISNSHVELLTISQADLIDLMEQWQHLYSSGYELINISLVGLKCMISGHFWRSYFENCRNDREIIEKQIHQMYRSVDYVEQDDAEIIENMIIDHLCIFPSDAHMWMRLALLEHSVLGKNPNKIVDYVSNALLYDQNNPYAVLFLAWVQNTYFEGIEDSTFERLENLKADDAEMLSMIEYAKSWYYSSRNNYEEYENHVLKSIMHCDKYVNNVHDFAIYCMSKGDFQESAQLCKLALANIREVDEDYDVADLNAFFNHFYTGTRATSKSREKIESLLLEAEEEALELKSPQHTFIHELLKEALAEKKLKER